MKPASDGKTVLIVEDEADIRKFASRVLELEGFRVLQAGNGDDGLRLVREEPVALVLLDLLLPEGTDGWKVLSQIKKEPQLSTIPVIVLSASAGAPSQSRARRMGAAAYLVKPVSAASLRKAVARVLGREE